MAVVSPPSRGQGLVVNPRTNSGGLATAVNTGLAAFKTARDDARKGQRHDLAVKQGELAIKREERLGKVAEMQLKSAEFELEERIAAAERAEDDRDTVEMLLGMRANDEISDDELVAIAPDYGPGVSEAIYAAVSPTVNWDRLNVQLAGDTLANLARSQQIAHNEAMHPLELATAKENLARSELERDIAGFRQQMVEQEWGKQQQFNQAVQEEYEEMQKPGADKNAGVQKLMELATVLGVEGAVEQVMNMNTALVPQALNDHTTMLELTKQLGEADSELYPVLFAAQVKSARDSKDPSVLDAIKRTTGMTNTQINQAVNWLGSINRKTGKPHKDAHKPPQKTDNMDAYSDWFDFADQWMSPLGLPKGVSFLEFQRSTLLYRRSLSSPASRRTTDQGYTREEDYERDPDTGEIIKKKTTQTPGAKTKPTKPTAPSIDDTVLFEGQPGDE